MVAITFDTLKFVRKLKESGMPENQAEAISEAFQEAQGEAELATQHDIVDVRRDIQDLRKEINEFKREIDFRLVQTEQRLTIKLGAMLVVAVGLMATLAKLL